MYYLVTIHCGLTMYGLHRSCKLVSPVCTTSYSSFARTGQTSSCLSIILYFHTLYEVNNSDQLLHRHAIFEIFLQILLTEVTCPKDF